MEAPGTKIGAKGGKLWVIANHLVIVRSLSSCGSRSSHCTSRGDGWKFWRRTDDVLDGDDHGKITIDVAVVIILVNNGKRARQQTAWCRHNGEDDAINRRGAPATSPDKAEEEEDTNKYGNNDDCVL